MSRCNTIHEVAPIKKSSFSVELVVVWAISGEVVFFFILGGRSCCSWWALAIVA